ncbi:MAG: 6-bladed beta-propeller [Balneolaceae bacterium]
MNRLKAACIIIILFAACSSQPETEIPEEIAALENLTVFPADSEPSMTINLEPAGSFGDTDEVIIGNLFGFVADHSGRVFIADGSENTIHAYNPDGSYLQSLGREGGGPGEFQGIGSLKVDNEYLYAMDWNQRKLNAFSLEDFSFSHTVSMMREDHGIEELNGAYPQEYFISSDNTFLVQYGLPFTPDNLDEERSYPFYRLNQEGEFISDQVLSIRAPEILYNSSGPMIMFSPFGRRSILRTANDDRIVTAWLEDFLIKFYSPDGTYEKAIYYPYKKAALDRDQVVNRYEDERMRRVIRNADAPDTWPALNSIIVDDENRLWVSTIPDDDEVYDWWVLNDGGELLARFPWPREKYISEITNGSLYTRETEEETGLVEVVQYRIELM